MRYYPLRSASDDNIVVEFTLADGVCPLDEDRFFLMNRPGTPILRYSRIMRGMDIPNLFEGDIIFMNAKRYLIVYSRGFLARADDKEILPLNLCSNYKVVSNVYIEPEIKIETVKSINYRFRNLEFRLDKIYGTVEDKLIVNAYKGILVPIKEVQQGARVSYKDEVLFFGDAVLDGELTLRNGRCCVKNQAQYTDITTGGILK